MHYVECPNEYPPHIIKPPNFPSIFLAGGISGCCDWQKYVVDQFYLTPCIIYNPRRKNFDANADSEAQIQWEFNHLKKADLILFWFPPQTVCPITLFEYGKYLAAMKPLVVGCHQDYVRRTDIVIQTRLERPDICVEYDLDLVISKAKKKLEYL